MAAPPCVADTGDHSADGRVGQSEFQRYLGQRVFVGKSGKPVTEFMDEDLFRKRMTGRCSAVVVVNASPSVTVAVYENYNVVMGS